MRQEESSFMQSGFTLFRALAGAAALLALLTMASCEQAFSPGPLVPVDFATLERAPDSYLVTPEGVTPGKSDAEAPVLGVSVEKLKESWTAMIGRQSDIEKAAESADGLQIDYIRRSKYLRMPDWITVRFIPLPSDPETGNYATLAVYSRSAYSSSADQQARVTAWLNGL